MTTSPVALPHPARPRRAAVPGRTYAAIVWEAASAPATLILFAVAAVLAMLGLTIDAAVTMVPLLLNVVVTAGLEARAKHRLDQLRILSAPTATRLADGVETRVDPADLVPGDQVVVGRGDQIAVDGEVLVGEVEVDEALVTGEPEPVVRRVGDALLSGSVCVAGRATLRVTRAGSDSYANRLTTEARTAKSERTPLQLDVDRLIATAGILVVGVSGVVAATSLGRHPDPGQMAQAAAVLVALVPQGLAIMSTVSYAMGALRISRAGALVQRISAVEAISRVDALVLDKTGTITRPDLEVAEVRWLNEDLAEGLRIVAALTGQPGSTDRVGEALARWLATEPAGSPSGPGAVRDVLPFSSARRWSGVMLQGSRVRAAMLGAPEVLVQSPADNELISSADAWMAEGRHVLVVSTSQASLRDAEGQPQLPTERTPIALIAFNERLRPDAASTLAALAAEGVGIHVVSGDAPMTAAAAAEAAGLRDARQHQTTGAVLDRLDDAALADRLGDVVVVGRVEPAMKARIVRVLRSRGRFVGMIGDGVNDIPAIKSANVGVAMGSGTSASRAVADIVLLGDRFAVVPQAVAEGRRIVDGMLGSASLLLTRTIYMALIILVAALAGLDFPFSPRNNSLLALVTVGVPSLVVLGWARPVASPASVVRSALGFAVPAAAAVAAIAIPVYAGYLHSSGSIEIARSALVTITVNCGTLLIVFLAQTERPGDRRPAVLAIAMVGIYALISALPLARWFFDLQPLPVADVIGLGLLGVVWAVAVAALRPLVRHANRPDRVTPDHPGPPEAHLRQAQMRRH